MAAILALILLAADGTDTGIPTWIGPASGAGGVLLGLTFTVWYAWHMAKNVVPTLVQDSHAAQEKSLAAIDKAREDYLTESKASRAEFKQALTQIVDHCREENDKAYSRFATVFQQKAPHGG